MPAYWSVGEMVSTAPFVVARDQALGQFFQRDKFFKEVGDDRTDASGTSGERAKANGGSSCLEARDQLKQAFGDVRLMGRPAASQN